MKETKTKEQLPKAEAIEKLCSDVIDKEKNKKHAEIRINQERICVLIKKKVLGYVTEPKPNEFKFQYVIS
nr:hypothetical protein [uncultured Flavobacterium sp.]